MRLYGGTFAGFGPVVLADYVQTLNLLPLGLVLYFARVYA